MLESVMIIRLATGAMVEVVYNSIRAGVVEWYRGLANNLSTLFTKKNQDRIVPSLYLLKLDPTRSHSVSMVGEKVLDFYAPWRPCATR